MKKAYAHTLGVCAEKEEPGEAGSHRRVTGAVEAALSLASDTRDAADPSRSPSRQRPSWGREAAVTSGRRRQEYDFSTMKRPIRFRLNGKPVSLETEDDRTLLWVLRGDLALTGTRYGCGEGLCGACTVAVNGAAVRSCQTTLADVDGKNVITIEGLEKDGRLHPLQQAFIDHGALQCGFCTSGMIMNAWAMLQKDGKPSRAAIVAGMDDNLCRCGAHQRIVAAIEEASR
jgi:aerobic-type carbon monoxide dehydrogenase small subunit (CoxS/CutS family)